MADRRSPAAAPPANGRPANGGPGEVVLRLTRAELLVLAASVNEAIEAVEDWEFPARLGAGKAEARALRAALSGLIAGHRPAAPAPAAPGRKEKGMAEIVRPRDGNPVVLRPCPPWCTLTRHFTAGQPVDSDDGYHHEGAVAEVATAYPFLGTTEGEPTIVRAALRSWTHPLGAAPGPVVIELNLGTRASRTDSCAELSPAEARAIARALLDLADAAERDGASGASRTPDSGEDARDNQEAR